MAGVAEQELSMDYLDSFGAGTDYHGLFTETARIFKRRRVGDYEACERLAKTTIVRLSKGICQDVLADPDKLHKYLEDNSNEIGEEKGWQTQDENWAEAVHIFANFISMCEY